MEATAATVEDSSDVAEATGLVAEVAAAAAAGGGSSGGSIRAASSGGESTVLVAVVLTTRGSRVSSSLHPTWKWVPVERGQMENDAPIGPSTSCSNIQSTSGEFSKYIV